LPKRGFNNPFSALIAEINVGQLEVFAAGAKVDETALRARGLIKDRFDRIKVLGKGELTKAVTVTAHSFSKGAQEKIAKAGGKAVLVAAAAE
jgi:large subunit ribosomal protein L15